MLRALPVLALCVLLAACGTPAPPNDPGLQAITLPPTSPRVTPSLTPERTPTPSPTPARPDPPTVIPEPACSTEDIARILQTIPPYTPGSGPFVALADTGFTLNGKRFVARGVNYYPAEAPWRRFPLSSLAIIERDFARLKQARTNTVRLFLWHDPFFLCPGQGAVPNPQAFLWLDSVLRLASAYGLRVILVLHDQPDLDVQPLYTDLGLVLAQTAYIVNRYRDEPAILAWDLRDSGDADYTPSGDSPARFERAAVLDWLARTAAAVRQLDPNHLLTAGWAEDSEAIILLVDFVSFQYFGDDLGQRERSAALRAYTAKPLLLIAFGQSTYDTSETDQARHLRAAVRAAEGDALAGWLVWTMTDFPAESACWPDPCAGQDGPAHHFGLWRADGSRKPAANAFETLAGG